MALDLPVVFVKYYQKGSTGFAGDQIAEGLRAIGCDARSIAVADLPGVRDSIAVFIKTSRLGDLLGARRRGNRTVLDVHDTLCFKRRLKNRWLFDGIIFRNRRQVADYGDAKRLNAIIQHQYDARYRPHEAGETQLAACYLGEPRSFRHLGLLPGVECIPEAEWFRAAPRFNCHLSVREPRREFLYKPGAKVSTAAVCRAVLITTPDETARELLGDDYPYFTAPDAASIQRAIAHASDTIGGPEWRLALDRLAVVRERTALARVLDDYRNFFRRLEAAR